MRALRYVAALVLCASLLVGNGAAASTPTTTPEQEAIAAVQSLKVGQEVVVLGNVTVARTSEGLVVDVVRKDLVVYPAANVHTAATFCGVGLASAIFGIGAGLLGFIAASTGGTGTVILAGYVFTGAQVGMMAAISGSYAALLAWISRYVC